MSAENRNIVVHKNALAAHADDSKRAGLDVRFLTIGTCFFAAAI